MLLQISGDNPASARKPAVIAASLPVGAKIKICSPWLLIE
jgi:hypothetical protein